MCFAIDVVVDELHRAVAEREVAAFRVRAAEDADAVETTAVRRGRQIGMAPAQVVPIVPLIHAAVVGRAAAVS